MAKYQMAHPHRIPDAMNLQTNDSELIHYQKTHPNRIPNAMFVQLSDEYDDVVKE